MKKATLGKKATFGKKSTAAKIKTRIEKDSMGELAVPADALYKAQTQRAINNFPVSHRPLPPAFITALALVKQCAAQANCDMRLLNKKMASAIIAAAQEVIDGKHGAHFPIDVYQTGSGTSSNMNMNEVLATLASKKSKMPISANDHVNMGQSSNDTIPTTIHVATVIELRRSLLPALAALAKAIDKKAKTLKRATKTGRTHLMDAMPIRMEQELSGWAAQINKGIARIKDSEKRVLMLAQGGTAIGTGINTEPAFAKQFCKQLKAKTGIAFSPNASFFESLSTQDAIVEMSGQLKTVAVSMLKIANDLRWMNSGPLAGLGEIELPALQPGSSIMPGKVNPVIPEATAMVAARVIGNDSSITIAGQSGNFQLNVMLPLVADSILESVRLLANVSPLLAQCISGFTVRYDSLQHSLGQNPILVTALNPVIGYLAAAKIAKRAYQERRPVLDVAAEETNLPLARLKKLLDPVKLTHGGIEKS